MLQVTLKKGKSFAFSAWGATMVPMSMGLASEPEKGDVWQVEQVPITGAEAGVAVRFAVSLMRKRRVAKRSFPRATDTRKSL